MHDAGARLGSVETSPIAEGRSKWTTLALELFIGLSVMTLRRVFGGDGGLVEESIVIGGDGESDGAKSSFCTTPIIKFQSQMNLAIANGVCKW